MVRQTGTLHEYIAVGVSSLLRLLLSDKQACEDNYCRCIILDSRYVYFAVFSSLASSIMHR